jgi:hypothetical protein
MVYKRLKGLIDPLGLRWVAARRRSDQIGPDQGEEEAPSEVAK